MRRGGSLRDTEEDSRRETECHAAATPQFLVSRRDAEAQRKIHEETQRDGIGGHGERFRALSSLSPKPLREIQPSPAHAAQLHHYAPTRDSLTLIPLKTDQPLQGRIRGVRVSAGIASAAPAGHGCAFMNTVCLYENRWPSPRPFKASLRALRALLHTATSPLPPKMMSPMGRMRRMEMRVAERRSTDASRRYTGGFTARMSLNCPWSKRSGDRVRVTTPCA